MSDANSEEYEELMTKHRKEVKDLTGKITALKKSVGKGAGDKKKVHVSQDNLQYHLQILFLPTNLTNRKRRWPIRLSNLRPT